MSGSAWSRSAARASGRTCCAGRSAAFPGGGAAGARAADGRGDRPAHRPGVVPPPRTARLRGYVPELHRQLAACDLAVVQGGLTTTMELVAARRPFLYVPLTSTSSSSCHVPHRLARYRAGRSLDYADLDPDRLAAAIAEEIDRPVDYRPVPTDGAAAPRRARRAAVRPPR